MLETTKLFCIVGKLMSDKDFKKLLDKKFKTKVEASKKLGVSRQTIFSWYSGKHKVPSSVKQLLKLLK